jgi:hypothetical protein
MNPALTVAEPCWSQSSETLPLGAAGMLAVTMTAFFRLVERTIVAVTSPTGCAKRWASLAGNKCCVAVSCMVLVFWVTGGAC